MRRADHSSRGVISTVARLCVSPRNIVNKGVLAHWGLSRHKQTFFFYNFCKLMPHDGSLYHKVVTQRDESE